MQRSARLVHQCGNKSTAPWLTFSATQHTCGTRTTVQGVCSIMARSQLSHGQTALVGRALATAQKEIERAERKFHQTIRSLRSTPVRAAQRSNAMTSRVSSPARNGTGKPAPVQTAITKVLSKR